MRKPLYQLKEIIEADPSKTRLAIMMHENPDPDCIASALGMARILKAWNSEIKCSYLYSGEIAHPQNKTFVNVLSIHLTHISEVENLKDQFDYFITVDVLPERCLPDDIECLMAIDHHRAETKRAKITDIRPVGATSSIIWDYLQKENIQFQENNDDDEVIATALSIGIKTDTSNLTTENVADLDWKASQGLMGFVNRRHLSSIDNYPIPPYYFDLRRQLDKEENFRSDKGVFVGGIGYITSSKRDAIPTMADERARVEGIETAFIFAIVGDYVEVSVRSSGLSVDVNALCQKIFGKQYAGGKMGAGASKIPLTLSLAHSSDNVKSKMWEGIREYIIERIFQEIHG